LAGSTDSGADSSAVQKQLRNVRQVCATNHAFAALLANGSVVTWGKQRYGGDDSSRVQQQRRDVRQISGTMASFAARLADGSVVTWGCSGNGGDSCRVQQIRSHIHVPS